MSQFNISPEEVSKLEEKFEIKSNERKLKNFLKLLTFIALVTMSITIFMPQDLEQLEIYFIEVFIFLL